jgi:AcrR family transcriptional regulator
MSSRPYTQTTRAATTARTRAALLDAAVDAFLRTGDLDTPLERIAADAGTTARTALRHYGTKDALIAAAIEHGAARVAAQRTPAAPGAEAAISALIDHYEQWGEPMAKLAAHAQARPELAPILTDATAQHLQWVDATFAADLDGCTPAVRAFRRALLATACDVETWRLLRRRHGLNREAVERAMLQLTRAAQGATP